MYLPFVHCCRIVAIGVTGSVDIGQLNILVGSSGTILSVDQIFSFLDIIRGLELVREVQIIAYYIF